MTSKADTTGRTLRRRLIGAGFAMVFIYGAGTLGYYLLGEERWSLSDCAYMTVISVTTVGYGETLEGLNDVPYARLWTSFLLVAGAGVAVYFLSVLTTFLVEGEFLQSRRRRKMEQQISRLSDHIIVCGVGGTGKHVVAELVSTNWEFVAIDTDPDKLSACQEEHAVSIPVMAADATDDRVLLEAGIERAYGVVATLPDDKGNLYVVVTARGLNPRLRIVAKAMDVSAESKLRVAGAHSVVSVNTIGGLRMASEMIRPNVVTFLDKMLRDKDKNLRFEEVSIPAGSPLADRRLAESDVRKERNVLIVAAYDRSGDYIYSPGPNFMLTAGMTLIVLGETEAVQRLRRSKLFRLEGG